MGEYIMREILVKSIYDVTQISKGNDEPWKLMQDIMVNAGADEHVMFNFKGVILREPWNNLEFKKFIADGRVHLRVYESEEIVNSIKIICMSLKTDTDRIERGAIRHVEAPKVENKSELEFVDSLCKEVYEREYGFELILNRVISQLGSYSTVDSIRTVIERYLNENNKAHAKFVINTGRMVIQSNVIEVLAETLLEYTANGYSVDVESTNKNVDKSLRTYMCLNGALKLNNRAKLRLIKENIKPGTVGFLAKYKESKGKDTFGRLGGGEVVISRPAIYLGMAKTDDNRFVVKFREFNGNTFHTKLQYALDNDGATLSQPKTRVVTLEISEIGFMSMFIGSRYHFNMPIQENKEDMVVVYKCEVQNGTEITTTEKITIPEFCKLVLDDHGVKYYREGLEEAIIETRNILDKK